MGLTGRFTVIQVKRIDFVPDPSETQPNPGRITLTKVAYLEEVDESKSRDTLGREIIKANGDISLFDKLKKMKVPGTFDIEFTQRPDAKGKPNMYISSMTPARLTAENAGEGEPQQ
jgi:hypothetical protein